VVPPLNGNKPARFGSLAKLFSIAIPSWAEPTKLNLAQKHRLKWLKTTIRSISTIRARIQAIENKSFK